MAQQVKNLPTVQETGDIGQLLGQENPLEEEMASHSNVSCLKNPRTEEFVRLQSKGSQRVRHNCVDTTG